MKTPFSLSFLLLALFLAAGTLTFTSCTKKGCTDSQSDNYDPDAKEDDGTCIPWKNKFIASYTFTESCDGSTPATYTLTITPSASAENKVIMTLSDGVASLAFTATVTGETSLQIENQTVNAGGISLTIQGSGSIAGNTLSLNYIVSYLGISENCSGTGIKQ